MAIDRPFEFYLYRGSPLVLIGQKTKEVNPIMDVKDSVFMNFVYVALELCKCIPLYSNNFSRKDFTQHQLMLLLILKQKLKCSYDTLIDDLKTRPRVIQLIGL
ncbi:hypothetical protein D6777_02940 [Candidatus Woesearchaeota archaeon]|nr:MAG: hypothetical protein D6777_02940 [Candidatus Woesearchaeota archaeon]